MGDLAVYMSKILGGLSRLSRGVVKSWCPRRAAVQESIDHVTAKFVSTSSPTEIPSWLARLITTSHALAQRYAMDIYCDHLRGLSADWKRNRRNLFDSFSTSGYLDISMGRRELTTTMSDDVQTMRKFGPQELLWLSQLRADHEGVDDLVSCEYGWGIENCSSYMVPVIFADGVEWIIKVQKPNEEDAEGFDFEPRLSPYERYETNKMLRSRLGSIVPEVIYWSEEDEVDGAPPWESVVITRRIRGERFTDVLESLLKGDLGPRETQKASDKVMRSLDDLANATSKLHGEKSAKGGYLIWGIDGDYQGPIFCGHWGYRPNPPQESPLDPPYWRDGLGGFVNGGEVTNAKRKALYPLLRHVLAESCHDSNVFTLRIEVSELIIDEETGKVRGIFTDRTPSYRQAPFSAFSYPEMLTKLAVNRGLLRLGPKASCIRGSCRKNSLGQTICEVWSHLLATWRLCISHYCSSTRRLSLEDIARSLSHPSVASVKCQTGSNSGCRWDSLMIKQAGYGSDEYLPMTQVKNAAYRQEQERQQEAGIGPFEPDRDHPGLIVMHFDHLFFHKAGQCPPINFDPRTPIDRLFNVRRRRDEYEQTLMER